MRNGMKMMSGRGIVGKWILVWQVGLGLLCGLGGANGEGAGVIGEDGVGVRLEVSDITSGEVGRQLLRVFYRGAVDLESLGEGDLWVVSHNGYNRVARFEGVEEVPDPGTDQNTGMEVVARYRLASGSRERWSAADNGEYTVLLDRQQVMTREGAFLAPRYLGVFRVRIGDYEPGMPVETRIRLLPEAAPEIAEVTLVFPSSGYEVLDWGEVGVEGNELWVDLKIMAPPDGGVLTVMDEQSHRYALPELPPGAYEFSVISETEVLASQSFEVHDQVEEVPAEVEMAIRMAEDGGVLADAIIHFLDPYFVLSNPGEPVLDGRRFVIEARAERVVFVRPPDEPAITEVTYRLHPPEPGVYGVVLKLNGRTRVEKEFEYPIMEDRRPVIHKFGVEPGAVDFGEAVTLFWEVTGADWQVIEPGVGVVEGNQITVVPEHPWARLWEEENPEPGIEPNSVGENGEVPVRLVPLVARSGEWKYLDGGAVPAPGWRETHFDDGAWKQGAAELGYGDGDEATVVDAGEDPEGKAITTYFRRTFDVEGVGIGVPLSLWLLCDDGAVVYINGEEILRFNMPEGEISPATTALRPVRGDGRAEIQRIILEPGLLHETLNTIAVEVHQVGPTSSDISFNLGLGALEGASFPPPGFTTTYHLVAENDHGSASATASVHVGEFRVPPPLESAIHIREENTEWYADVEIVPAPNTFVVSWGEAQRIENRFSARVELESMPMGSEEAFEDPDGNFPEMPHPEPNHFTYPLGQLDPGVYGFELKAGGHRIAVQEFHVPRKNEPTSIAAILHVEPILEAGVHGHPFRVVYESGSELDVESFGDDDIAVSGGPGSDGQIAWEVARVELMDLGWSEDRRRVEAHYQVFPPEGGWTAAMNGPMEFFLRAQSVRTTAGEFAAERHLGGSIIDIESLPPPIDVRLHISKQNSAVAADVRVEFGGFPYYSILDWGRPHLEGRTFWIDAEAGPVDFFAPPELPLVEEHRYFLIGALSSDDIPLGVHEFQEIRTVLEPRNVVLRSETDWYELWGIDPEAPVEGELPDPPVDFSERTLLGVFLGMQSTGGYEVAIRRAVYDDDGSIRVDYLARIPAPGDPVPEVITYPQAFASIPKTDRPVHFHGHTVVGYPEANFAAPTESGDPNDILPPTGEYRVIFRINGTAYAEAGFLYEGDLPPQEESLIPGEVHLSAEVEGDHSADISAELDFTNLGFPVAIRRWGEAIRESRRLEANVEVERQDSNGLETPGARPVFHNAWHLENLEPGHHVFLMRVNGTPVSRVYFMIDGEEPFLEWLGENLDQGQESSAAGVEIYDIDDADGDGDSDYYEWALGLNPMNPADHTGIKSTIINRDGKPNFAIHFNRHKPDDRSPIYHLEVSDDLVHWIPLEDQCDELAVEDVGGGMEGVTVCLRPTLDQLAFQFVRIRVEEPDIR